MPLFIKGVARSAGDFDELLQEREHSPAVSMRQRFGSVLPTGRKVPSCSSLLWGRCSLHRPHFSLKIDRLAAALGTGRLKLCCFSEHLQRTSLHHRFFPSTKSRFFASFAASRGDRDDGPRIALVCPVGCDTCNKMGH